MRALLVVIALSLSLAILVAIPAGITANQNTTQALTENLSNNMAQSLDMLNQTITETQATINQTLTEIDCSLTQSAPQGFGYTGSGTVIGSGPIGGNTGTSPVIVNQYGGGPLGGGSLKPMNQTYYADVANVSGVAAVEPILQVTEGHNRTVTPTIVQNGIQSQGPSMNVTIPDYIIEGIPLKSSLIENYPILPTNITVGGNLQPGETGDVLLSENNSAYFKVGVGDTINILGENFTVIGIYSPSSVSDTQKLYMNLEDAQELTNNNGTITSFDVFTENSDVVSSVANALSAAYPELIINTAQDRLTQLQNMESMYQNQLQSSKSTYESAIASTQNTMNATQTQALEEIIIAVAATSMIVLFVMLYTVRERTKEIGTLKAIGFSNFAVMSQFMLEGVLLSLIAGAVGVAMGVVAAPMLSSLLLPHVNLFNNSPGLTIGQAVGVNTASQTTAAAALTVSPELILIALGAAALLGVIGSLYPAWRAARTRPAEAMRYE